MSNKGFNSQQKKSSSEFVTVQNLGGGRYGLDVIQRVAHKTTAVPFSIASVDAEFPKTKLHITAHGASSDAQFIRFDTGANAGVEYPILEVIDANTLIVSQSLESLPVIGDDLFIMNPISLTVTEDGGLITSAGPVEFVKDSVSTQVTKDTVTSTNTVGMPVEIVGTDGAEINITAGDINVQLEHTGASPDSTRIGNGVNELGINASLEALVHDTDALAKQDELLIELKLKADLTETQPVSLLGKATEVKQDAIIAKNDEILVELKLKADLLETQPVSLIGNATEAKQDSMITELQAIQSQASGIIVDFIDVGILDSSSTNITTTGTQIVGSLAADVKKIQIFEDIGEYLTLRNDSGAVLAYLPLGGGDVIIAIPAGTILELYSETGSAITSGKIAMNFIG